MKTREDLYKHLDKVSSCCKYFRLLNLKSENTNFTIDNISKFKIVPIKCTSYFCPQCVKKRKFEFLQRVKQNLKGSSWRFMTLTTSMKDTTPEEAAKKISKSWNTFATTLRKKYPNLKYCKVLEIGHLNGMVHLHILVNCYIDKRFIKNNWCRIHGAIIIDISKVKSYKASLHYMAKYTSKATCSIDNEFYFLNSKRRFSFSKNWEKIEKRISEWIITYNESFSYSSLEDLILIICRKHNFNLDNFILDSLPPPLRDKFLYEIFI